MYIDNLVGFVSDVDFFTFQGLAPGTEFTAETTNVDAGDIDTLLGWFDEGGTLLDVNDDIDLEAGNYLSRLTGAVPASGTLTFAVTGYGDDDFLGYHEQFEAYELILSLAGGGSPADFDGSGAVDAGDLGTWGANFGASGASPSQGDANGDGVVSGVDFLIWQQETSGPTGSAGGVPEPAAAGLALLGLAVAAAGRRRR
ncbi:MAG: hypothetical protein CMJ58_20365 [Planctomycetaceae bacterium]|nr:hypothetical protein [Planctomycetaceae bacterium]